MDAVVISARPSRQAIAAGALAALTVVVTAVTVVLAISVGEDDVAILGPLVVLVCVTPALTGLAILARRPGNVIGWLLVAHGALAVSVMFASEYAIYGAVEHPGSLPAARWAALWGDAGWPAFFVAIAAIAFVMPDGRFLSARWRRFGIASGAAFAALQLVLLFSPQPFEGRLRPVESPLPRLEAADALIGVLVLAALGGLVAAAAAVRARLRRADGVARLQLIWFAYAALLIPGAVLVCLADVAIAEETGAITLAAMCVAGTAVPLSIGAAILRHRLFDIELVLSRTLVYGALTVGVVVVYVVVVAGLGGLLDDRGTAGLLAVGLVAVGVEPLRARVQQRVDRLVYGDRRTPYEALRRLSDRLQQTLVPGAVVQTVVDSVAEALRLPYAAVELERETGPEVAAAHGEPARGELVRLPLTYQGEAVGRLVVQVPPGRELAPADRSLLADLAGHAGVAVHAVRLTADLQRSRERLVSAREEERRRIRRDLHDGLGPTLAAIALKLDTAGAMAGPTPLGDVVTQLRGETREAIASIRRLVDELRPPALDELGLVPALAEHAARLSTPNGLAVRVDGPDPAPALPAAIEVAAYRIALEAMTNAARHARARACVVRIAVNGALEIEVADDGAGLPAEPRAGVGLASMRERADELGGTCAVAGRPEGGTRVRAVLPLERA